jgi:hypothetical protein
MMRRASGVVGCAVMGDGFFSTNILPFPRDNQS